MTERQMENRIKKLQAIEAKQKELEEQAAAIKKELQEEMVAMGIDEVTTRNGFIIRWKEIISSRLDGRALKEALPEIYKQYCKQSSSRRFTVA